MKGVILDLGGVCVYPPLGHWNIPVNYREVLGARAQSVFTEEFIAQNAKNAALHLSEGIVVPSEADERAMRVRYYRAMGEDMLWQLTQAEIAALADCCTGADERYALYPDVLPYLRRWRGEGRALGILSDAMPSIHRICDHLGLSKAVDALSVSTDVGALKPDPRMYRDILQKLDLPAASLVFVDDRPCNLEGARRMGMGAVQMHRGNQSVEFEWDGPLARDFEELDGILRHEFSV